MNTLGYIYLTHTWDCISHVKLNTESFSFVMCQCWIFYLPRYHFYNVPSTKQLERTGKLSLYRKAKSFRPVLKARWLKLWMQWAAVARVSLYGTCTSRGFSCQTHVTTHELVRNERAVKDRNEREREERKSGRKRERERWRLALNL